MSDIKVKPNFDEVGEVADTIDNLVATTRLAMPASFHLDQLRKALPECSKRLKNFYVGAVGVNPRQEGELE